MSTDDAIEKLLREIGSQDSQKATPSPKSASKTPAKSGETSSGGRIPFATAGAAVMGAGGAVSGLILPGISMLSTGIGAAAGAFLIALIAGPPRWFSR